MTRGPKRLKRELADLKHGSQNSPKGELTRSVKNRTEHIINLKQ